MANGLLYPESKLSSRQLKIIELVIFIVLIVMSTVTAVIVGLSIKDINDGIHKSYTFKHYEQVEYGKGDRPYQIFVEEETTALYLDSGVDVSVLNKLAEGDTFSCRVRRSSNGILGYQYCYQILEMSVGDEVVYPLQRSLSNDFGVRLCVTVMFSLTAVILLTSLVILLIKDRKKRTQSN